MNPSNQFSPTTAQNQPGGSTTPPNRLFIPGPVDVDPAVMAAQTIPMIGHRSDEFESLFAKVQSQLRQLFYTQSRVYVLAATGSGMHEAAIRNAAPSREAGGRVLHVVSGAFGQRWHDVSVGCAKEVIRMDVPWCTAVKPEQMAEALTAALQQGPVHAVCVVHNETSTGVTQPIGPIAETVRRLSPESLILVDAVSSFSGMRIPFDEWGLDLCLTSSQKALALPPGLAFAAVSDRLLDRAAQVDGRGWYFDFLNLEKYLLRDTTPATPAISLMRALSVQLDRIFSEGVESRFARHEALAHRTQAWAEAHGLGLTAEAGYRSHTVTAVDNTLGWKMGEVDHFLQSRDMQISDGYGPFKGKSFRIGHMGEIQLTDLDRLFAALEEFKRG